MTTERPSPILFPLVLGALLTCSAAVTSAQDEERREAEAQLADVTRQIQEMQQRLEASRADHRAEQARLREVDLAIQAASLESRQLERDRQAHIAQLAELERQKADYLASLDQRQDELAAQIRAAYRSGGQSRLKLLLNQDDPERLARMLGYYDYLNRARAEDIERLRQALQALAAMQASIDGELEQLALLSQQQEDVLSALESQREERKELLAELGSRIVDEEQGLEELRRNARDLEALIEKLADALADIPADLGQQTGLSGQKGQLPMPVKGPVRQAFGQRRAAGLSWRGWLIGADAGTEVSAIAYGRVAFADWLRGYGLLLIIDHGDGFLSLYAHNESLLQEAGSWVEPGAIIGIVGSNPGSGQGLYFELRKDGKAVDPAAWIDR